MNRWRGAIFVVAISFTVAVQAARAEDKAPDWFHFDSDRPYAIFDAWKELSTRRAMVCIGENWSVLAGRLQNRRGEPVPNTLIKVDLVRGKARSASVQTDDSGYFLIYSPWSLELDDSDVAINRRSVIATPGYPATQAGQAFAYKRGAARTCEPKLVLREAERAFYVLTCDNATGFDADEFKTFEREYLDQRFKPKDPFQDEPREPEGKPKGIIQSYDIRVVDETDKSVPNALVKYQLSGLSPGFQIRKTDDDGRCRLEEWPPGDGGHVWSTLTIEASGLGAGPMLYFPKLEASKNVVRLARRAVVEGRMIDDAGNPVACQLSVHYKRQTWLPYTFYTDFYSQPDGSFRFERVVPDEEFRMTAHGSHFGQNRWADIRTGWLSLRPGEKSSEVRLQLSLASSLRGIIVSEDGKLTRSGISLDYGPHDDFSGNDTRYYVGTNNGPWGPNDGRFGFYGLDSRPFRIRVYGWEVEPTEPLQLEPGEMRFVRVTLKKKIRQP